MLNDKSALHVFWGDPASWNVSNLGLNFEDNFGGERRMHVQVLVLMAHWKFWSIADGIKKSKLDFDSNDLGRSQLMKFGPYESVMVSFQSVKNNLVTKILA